MKTGKKVLIIVCALVIILGAVAVSVWALPALEGNHPFGNGSIAAEKTPVPLAPDAQLIEYIDYLNAGGYAAMYGLLSDGSKAAVTEQEFIARHENIYGGIDAKNVRVSVSAVNDLVDDVIEVAYSMSMDTLAGPVSFDNIAVFMQNADGQYRLQWSTQTIFPGLNADYRVRVQTNRAERGRIFDRNGELLAGPGIASAVGFVPGKMRLASDVTASVIDTTQTPENSVATPVPDATDAVITPNVIDNTLDATITPEPTPGAAERYAAQDIELIATLLETTPESIYRKLDASYVTDTTFVALRTVSKEAYELKEQLLTVPGIMITDTTVRVYPLAEKASHLTGYVQSISAEELEQLRDKGYNSASVLGKAGMEKHCEDVLRAVDGYEILIQNAQGETMETLARTDKRDGGDVYLTVDSSLQSDLYDQLAEDKGAAVAMNHSTGEVLALVSTPSYDSNDFALGMTGSTWDALNSDENKPLLNRFQSAMCPGSVFKPITGAVGLETGLLTPEQDFGPSGPEWRKDGSWGGYYVTTLREYDGPAALKNALTYSDNIYFAKAALQIGAEPFAQGLKAIGLEEEIPFEFPLYSSIISSTETFTSEIQLADSGFGQGELLMNPIHMASVYSAFVNDGSMLKPYLLMQEDNSPMIWKQNAFSPETAEAIKDGLVSVVENGTGSEAHVEGVTRGGKTGTAEIKQTKDDDTGTELGWFVLFDADTDTQDPLMVVAMIEDVKDRGGSGYVVPKVVEVFAARARG